MDMAVVLFLLLAALPLGMLHAFDPDHLVAVSTLAAHDRVGARAGNTVASHGPSNGASWRYGFLWALGHGGLLLLIAMSTLLFHWALPPTLPMWAERLVGVILIAAGGSMLLALLRGHALARSHSHGSRPILRAPLMVGMVHGLAGSATMLAVVPVTLATPQLGLAYVVVFSLGVMAGMTGFGLMFGRLHHWLAHVMPGFVDGLRGCVALVAIGMGVVWLQAA